MKRTALMLSLLLAAAAPPAARAEVQYFGYWANNGYQHENNDHTNITHVWTGRDSTAARAAILDELQRARDNGVKAVISLDSFLFTITGPDSDPIYSQRHDAASAFGALLGDLVTAGYLVPGDPARSTVAAFYPIDEPELHHLSDLGGVAHPTLANAIGVIRADSRTAGIPIAMILSKKFRDAAQGLRLVDWVGVNNYGANDSGYIDTVGDLQDYMRPQQREIMVPQAGVGGILDHSPHTPETMYAVGKADPRVIMLLPFLWGHANTNGVRTHVSLKASYTAIGKEVKHGLFGSFVSQSVNPTMLAGVPATVSITMKNTSSQTWRPNDSFGLGSQNPGDNLTWGLHRVNLPYAVAPQQNVTFTFTVVPPSTPGNYNFQWRLVKEGIAWFGDATPNVVVNVKPKPTGSISASPNPCVIPIGGAICTANITWNSNQPNAQIIITDAQGNNPQLFAGGQSGSQSAPWIGFGTIRFNLGIPGYTITSVDVRGVSAGAKEPARAAAP